VITTRAGQYSFSQFDNFVIENRPVIDAAGIFYHIAVGYWFIRVVLALIWYRPDVVIATALQDSWFWLGPLRLLGIVVVPAIHCVLWPRFLSLRRSTQFIMYLNRILFYEHTDAILAVAPEVSDQLRAFIHKSVDILVFYPMFLRDYFDSIPPPKRAEGEPFRIMFSGRIVQYKGVYIIGNLAKKLERDRRGQFKFDICGDGPHLAKLCEYISENSLGGVVNIHGHCDADQLRSVLSQAHAVIVPTTTSFEEGFPKVCAEAILAGRPVIASTVCCGLARIRDAAIEVPPNNVDGYYQAILQLSDHQDLYERKCKACESLQEQFYDFSNSYGEKFRAILQRHVLETHN
jgi:glycosyltransferase involved in cell wall biosynthesis